MGKKDSYKYNQKTEIEPASACIDLLAEVRCAVDSSEASFAPEPPMNVSNQAVGDFVLSAED